MPPIRIHKDAPIKPDGITPKTVDDNPSSETPAPTRTTPASNPATTTASADGPPPPQPGARPIPPTASPYAPTSTSSNPPAPQPGAVPSQAQGQGYTATHTTLETRLSAPPPQFSIPPPSDTQLAGRSTSTSTNPSTSTSTSNAKPGPTTLNLGPAAPAPSPFQQQHTDGSLDHPPGYVQAPDHLPSGGGIQDSPMERENTGADAGGASGVGGAAWNMLSRAGEALKKGEEAAWRAVRNN